MTATTTARQERVGDAGPLGSPPNSETDNDGARHYTHPRTGEVWPSVTTVLGVLNKPKLPYWAADLAATAAMDRLPMLVKASRRRPCERSPKADDACGRCRVCVTWWIANRHIAERDDASDRGRRIHQAAEHYVLHGEIPPHAADIAPYVVQFRKFIDEYQVTYDMAEAQVFSRHAKFGGHCGTLDGIIRCGWMPRKHKDWIGRPLEMDIKSGRKVWDEAALQLAAYRHSPVVLLPNGDEEPKPATDGAVTVHIRPDGYWVRPMSTTDDDYEDFLAALRLFRREQGTGGVGRAMTKPRDPKPDAEQRPAAPAASKPRTTKAATKKTAAGTPTRSSVVRRADPFHVVGSPATNDDPIPF